MTIRKTPYQHLLDEYRDFVMSVYRGGRSMFFYKKTDLQFGWSLVDIYERTRAAAQLGYDVVLEAKDDGLHVKYREKIPQMPWRFL